ncbi:MAG: hypothetical protein GQ525_15230 [Draconibacterium sp.]|nr:hypothetical protein [Draconibacterium sp.]
MKTRINQLAAITLLVILLLAGNVNAKGTELDASSNENIEATLEIENWMVNDYFWNTGDMFTFETANDETLDLENWMTDNNVWEVGNSIAVETETEQEMAIEPWMTDENIWIFQ